MFGFLKQSTASQSRMVGPFVDDTDFKTAETALTIANTDVKISKNGAAGVNKTSGGGTHRNNGMYSLTFDATDTDTVGELEYSVAMAGALVVVGKFWVLEEAIYDALFGASAAGFDANQRVDLGKWLGTAAATPTTAGVPEVDVTYLGGVAQSLLDLKDFADAGYDPATNKVQGVVLSDTVTTLTGHTPQTGDSFARLGVNGAGLSALPWNAAWDAEVESEVNDALVALNLDHLVGTATGIPAIPAGTFLDQIMDDGTAVYDRTTDSLQAIADSGGGGPTAAQIADAVWEEAQVDHVAVGTFGITASEIADILLDTNELQTDDVPGLIAALNDPTAAAIVDAVWDEAKAGHVVAGSFGEEVQAHALSAEISALNDLSAVSVENAVWDAARASHVGVGSFGEGVLVQTNNDKTGYAIAVGGIAATSFAAGAINAAATATDFIDEIWAKICEDQGNYSALQILSILLSACAGVTTGSTFKTANGVSSRISATLNVSEERTAMTLNPSAGA